MSDATSAEEFRNMIELKKKEKRKKALDDAETRVLEIKQKSRSEDNVVNDTTRKIIKRMRETSSFKSTKLYNKNDINKLDKINLLSAYENAISSGNLISKVLIRSRIFKLVGETHGR